MESTLDLLFDSSSLIPSEIKSEYPAGYTVRPLARDDYHRGFFECLKDLTWTGDISENDYHERFDWQKENGKGWYYCVVIVDDAADRIVGTGTVVIEKKFIHNLSITGHIEDVSIAKDHQGKHFGQRLLKSLNAIALNAGCVKAILNCAPHNEGFYAKCGYEKAGTEMSCHFEKFREYW
ncbi:glucosamine 6-phosphate N-acetyltransferase, putative [Talaromyces stipitatus ATCC 10500]|uniref:Glucosamine 6-phosphate N-acetyltransferase n=1 Tax=Talaromyces stipitatus (strain ATCC 10500 / CBS 375.48 / QM 6759 / NRRL 1006) TaxID=441959 RepID=B8M7W4_TALSN|nr:glucosamine 6-phosphate N-acetyltransferase, putative [Talaromyces stipitatus ATCC 10500]EED19843.1 glucosamine 6-phosphate N-acetyltransferase, putative [Talaromyces stipitatus ATCC 10500]